jgi:hypothetical protein
VSAVNLLVAFYNIPGRKREALFFCSFDDRLAQEVAGSIHSTNICVHVCIGSGRFLCQHHHQPINVPTAGAQAFLMDNTYNFFLVIFLFPFIVCMYLQKRKVYKYVYLFVI